MLTAFNVRWSRHDLSVTRAPPPLPNPTDACMRKRGGLTFELSGRRRQDARPGLAKMYRVPSDRAWWPAVGAPLERGVRHPCAPLARRGDFACLKLCFPRSATTRAVAVLRVCGVRCGPCMALCALQCAPRCWLIALMSCSRRVELTCCAALLSAFKRGHSLYELRHRSLLGHSVYFVQSGSFCCDTFPAGEA